MRATQDVLKNTKGIECVLNAGSSENYERNWTRAETCAKKINHFVCQHTAMISYFCFGFHALCILL